MKVFQIKIFNQKHNQVKKNVSVQKRKRDKLVCYFTVPRFILNTDTELVLMQGILVETVKPQCAYIHSTPPTLHTLNAYPRYDYSTNRGRFPYSAQEIV